MAAERAVRPEPGPRPVSAAGRTAAGSAGDRVPREGSRHEAGEGRRGSLLGGSVEMSNVDLAAEFTNLILAQRGFQASSRVITTSDQVLEDLVNIKR